MGVRPVTGNTCRGGIRAGTSSPHLAQTETSTYSDGGEEYGEGEECRAAPAGPLAPAPSTLSRGHVAMMAPVHLHGDGGHTRADDRVARGRQLPRPRWNVQPRPTGSKPSFA